MRVWSWNPFWAEACTRSENHHCHRMSEKRRLRIGASSGAHVFNTIEGKPSRPEDLFVTKFAVNNDEFRLEYFWVKFSWSFGHCI